MDRSQTTALRGTRRRVMCSMMLQRQARQNELRARDLLLQVKRIRTTRTRRPRKIIQRLLEL